MLFHCSMTKLFYLTAVEDNEDMDVTKLSVGMPGSQSFMNRNPNPLADKIVHFSLCIHSPRQYSVPDETKNM